MTAVSFSQPTPIMFALPSTETLKNLKIEKPTKMATEFTILNDKLIITISRIDTEKDFQTISEREFCVFRAPSRTEIPGAFKEARHRPSLEKPTFQFTEEFANELHEVLLKLELSEVEFLDKEHPTERKTFNTDEMENEIETLDKEAAKKVATEIHTYFLASQSADEAKEKERKEFAKASKGRPTPFAAESKSREPQVMQRPAERVRGPSVHATTTDLKTQREHAATEKKRERRREQRAIEKQELQREIIKEETKSGEIKKSETQNVDRKKET